MMKHQKLLVTRIHRANRQLGTDSIKKTFVDIYDNIKTGIRKTSRFFSPKPPIFVYMNQKSLFEGDFQSPYNLLPKDGVVHYFESFLDHRDSKAFHNKLLHNIDWRHDVLFMFGKKITTKRKVAWYGDKDISYTYSKVTKLSTPWTEELLHLKNWLKKRRKRISTLAYSTYIMTAVKVWVGTVIMKKN